VSVRAGTRATKGGETLLHCAVTDQFPGGRPYNRVADNLGTTPLMDTSTLPSTDLAKLPDRAGAIHNKVDYDVLPMACSAVRGLSLKSEPECDEKVEFWHSFSTVDLNQLPQKTRTSACHAGGRGFDSRRSATFREH
jgi:hypothetical protein